MRDDVWVHLSLGTENSLWYIMKSREYKKKKDYCFWVMIYDNRALEKYILVLIITRGKIYFFDRKVTFRSKWRFFLKISEIVLCIWVK